MIFSHINGHEVAVSKVSIDSPLSTSCTLWQQSPEYDTFAQTWDKEAKYDDAEL